MNFAKRLSCLLLCASLTASCASCGSQTNSSSEYPKVNLVVDTYPVNLTNECLLINSSTMIPLREISTYSNMQISWDEETMSATISSSEATVTVTEGSNVMKLNGTEMQMPAPALTVNDRMYVPIRAVSQALGYEVDYSAKSNTAYIFTTPREILSVPEIIITTTALNDEDKEWLKSTLDYSTQKVAKTVGRTKGNVIYSSQNGFFTNKGAENTNWWTNGFYPGILWIMYENTLDSRYADYALQLENRLAHGLSEKGTTDHDLGFLWMLSGWKNYSLTGNETSKENVINAAQELYARYNRDAKFIVAWNGKSNENKSIIDTMMNLDLMYTATNLTRNPVYAKAASNHADTTIKNFVRADGSCHHQVVMDPLTGERTSFFAGQGYDDGSGNGSHWARGNAWALYGFAKCFGYTGNIKYLETSKKIASYYEANLRNGYEVPMDFNQPSHSKLTDTSAAAIAASGLIDLAHHTDDEKYLTLAVNILKSLTEKHGGDNGDEALLTGGCVTYSNPVQQTLIYGDYYYLEALMKLKNFSY